MDTNHQNDQEEADQRQKEPLQEEESINRLREIEELETQLKLERIGLLRRESWYRKPGNWIGLAAIVVSITIAILSGIKEKELALYGFQTANVAANREGNP